MKKLLHQGKMLFQHELISGSSYMFIGSMVGNVCAFLFNLFLARKFTAIDYGVYASLLSLFSLTVLVPQSFLTTIVQFATQYFSVKKIDEAKNLYRQSLLFLSIIGVGIFFIFLFASYPIGVFLHINNPWYIGGIGVIIIFSFINSVNISYMQSLLFFGFMSFLQALSAFVKLLGGVVLVFLGFGIFGAIGGILLSFLIPFAVSFWKLGFLFSPSKKSVRVPLWDMTTYAIPSMVTAIALASFISTDVILAKHFLDGTQAGMYAKLSIVGKAIFYFTGIIPSVMFPVLVNKFTKGHVVHTTFYLGLLLVGAPSLLITAFYFLFPRFVLAVFLGGGQGIEMAHDVGFMALFLSLYSVITVLVNFFLSLKQTWIVFPVGAMAILQIVSIFLFHGSILQIITVSTIVSSGLIIILGLYFFYHHTIAKTYIPSVNPLQEI